MTKIPVSVPEAKNLSNGEKEELLRIIEQEAQDNEVEYWGCSQAVLKALQQHFDLGNDEVFKAASPFAGGIGRLREACGALTGGVMAIGLVLIFRLRRMTNGIMKQTIKTNQASEFHGARMVRSII